jgi:hypothetical protein
MFTPALREKFENILVETAIRVVVVSQLTYPNIHFKPEKKDVLLIIYKIL